MKLNETRKVVETEEGVETQECTENQECIEAEDDMEVFDYIETDECIEVIDNVEGEPGEPNILHFRVSLHGETVGTFTIPYMDDLVAEVCNAPPARRR